MYKYIVLLLLISFIFLTGCSSKIGNTGYSPYNPYSPTIMSGAYKIADSFNDIEMGSKLVVASFADVNNLEKSSAFGRMISEQIASRLCQNGYEVKEIKLRKSSIFLSKGEGDFVLSRDVKEVGNEYDVTYFIVGTYAELSDSAYISARAIRPEDNTIVSSCDVYVPVNYKNKRHLFSSN